MSDVARDPDVASRLARAENERWHVIQPLSHEPIMGDWAEAESVIYDCQTDGEDLLRTIVFRAIRHGRELERQSLTKGENA